MKLLIQTNDPAKMAFAQALLQGEGITSFELDVHSSIMECGLGILPRRLMVAERDHWRAVIVMRDNDVMT